MSTNYSIPSYKLLNITKGNERNIYASKPMFNTDLSIYKGILHDHLSFQLYVSDLFGTNDDASIRELVLDKDRRIECRNDLSKEQV